METTTPNSIETTPAEFDKEGVLKYVLSYDQIQDLRNNQRQAFYDAQTEARDNGVSFKEAIPYGEEAAQRLRDEYFNHIAEGNFFSDDDLSSIDATINKYSFLSMSDLDWRTPKTTDDGSVVEKKGSDLLNDDLNSLLDHVDSVENDDEATETEEDEDIDIEDEKAHLDTLRDKLAVLSAKRQGRIFGNGGKKYDEALKAYNDQVIKLGKLEHQALIEDEEATEITKKATIVAYLLIEQNNLRELSMEKLKGTAVHKFVEMMNKGNFGVRLLKGIALGAGASVVAAGAGAVLGVAGGAALIGGATAGIIGAARFARGFARSDARKGRGMQTLNDISHLEEAQETEVSEPSSYFEEVQKHYINKFESDTDKEQRKRLKSVGAGVLGIALGTGLGFVAQSAVDSGVFDGWMNRGPSLPFDVHDTQPETPDVNGDTPETPDVNGDLNGDGIPDYQQDSPDAPTETADIYNGPDAGPEYDVSIDPSFFIDSGEGGIHFFQDLGLTEGNWYEVHQELLQNFPNDFYPMGEGQVGLAHSGPLSAEAQQFIKTRFNLS